MLFSNVEIPENVVTLITLIADIALPVVLLVLGWLFTRHDAKAADRRARSRIAAEWRLEVFRDFAETLNGLYQFFTYLGEWREMTPDDAISLKRRLDRVFWANRFLWSEQTEVTYEEFISIAFEEFRGRGERLRLKANVDRYAECSAWKEDWRRKFVTSDQRVERADFTKAHDALIDTIVTDLDLLSKLKSRG